jgi:hypothetical protein
MSARLTSMCWEIRPYPEGVDRAFYHKYAVPAAQVGDQGPNLLLVVLERGLDELQRGPHQEIPDQGPTTHSVPGSTRARK